MVISGGCSPANLRMHPDAVEPVKSFYETVRPLAAICHAPRLLSAAGPLQRGRITGYRKTREETPEAGADRRDATAVSDGRLVTSGGPSGMGKLTAASEAASTGARKPPASDNILRGGPPRTRAARPGRDRPRGTTCFETQTTDGPGAAAPAQRVRLP